MGGTALKEKYGFVGQRLNQEEYLRVCNELESCDFWNRSHMAVIPCYSQKQDHGDIDAVITIQQQSPETHGHIVDRIKTLFHSQYVVKNSNVYSFEYENKYQIDLAVCPRHTETLNYFNFCSYSPFGNGVGRILKQTGLKFGLDGLTYPVKLTDSEVLGEISIYVNDSPDKNFYKMLEFFGSDRNYHNFQTQEEIFDFLTGSRFFNRDIFLYENLNHINRKRDSKRADYHNLLEFIKDKPNKFYGDPDKTVYISEIERHFDVDIIGQWETLLGKFLVKREKSKRFSGEDVSRITGKVGKDLGEIMKNFRTSFNYDQYLLTHSSEEVEKYFIQWHEKWVANPTS